jgi:hypothetical protein
MYKIITNLFIFTFLLFSQKNNAQSWGDYTLIARQGQTSVSLINLSNTAYKTWSGLSGNNGYSAYLLPGGVLMRSVSTSGGLSGGGVHGRIQKVDWNGTLLWDYTLSTSSEVLHHDFCPLPNGNVLVIAYQVTTAAQRSAVGYTGSNTLWTENIFELQQNGLNGATKVWEWHLLDHLCQNTNAALPNYFVPSQHPELLNINYNSAKNDWVHMNGIDFNEATNQIIVSSHFLNEAWVIDHSTTTTQAASHSGGNGGKGGDFLYRYGNPAAYGLTGTTFNVIHDAHWIPSDCPNANNMVVFHNNGGAGNSAVDSWTPPASGYNFTLNTGTAYGPSSLSNHLVTSGFSSNMGNSQQLPNGNQLVCIATAGYVYEVNSAGTTVWSYNTGGSTPQARRYSACYVNGNPSGTIAPTVSTVCSGQNSTLNFTPTAAGTYTYAWSSNVGGFSSSLQNPIVSPTQTTTYTVNITSGSGSNSCSGTAQVTINVGTAPTANAGNDVTINTGQSTTLIASGGSTYSWSSGQSGASISVSPSTTTTYTVTVTNASGCSAIDQVIVNVTSAPVSATASASSTTICSGYTTSLNVTPLGGTGTYTYSWTSTPSGFLSSLKNPGVAPTQTTTYNVVVTSGTSSTNASVTVNVNPNPIANAGSDVTINQGQSTVLTASGGSNYTWSNGQSGATITVAPSGNTSYFVTVTDGNGCTNVDNVLVTVIPSLNAIANSVNPSVCAGNSVQLLGSANGGTGNYTYSWASSNGSFTSSNQNPIVSPTTTTSYNLTVTSGTLTSTSAVIISVNPLPIASAGNDVTINLGQNAVLTASGGNTYLWSNGNLNAINTVSPTSTTNYSVTVTNLAGCKATSQVNVTVVTPTLTTSASSNPSTICAGKTVTLDVNASGGAGNYTYAWSSIPSGFSSILKNPSVTPSATTTYNVTVTSGTNSNSSSTQVIVNPLPIANAGADVTISVGQNTNLSASGGTSYLWSNGITTANNSVSPTQTTTYIVTVTNSNLCQSTDNVIVTVSQLPTLTAIATITTPTICKGDSTQLNVNANGGTGTYSYVWASTPSGFSSTLKNPKITPSQNTTYNVTVTSGANSITSTTNIIVIPLPIANAGKDSTITIGQNLNLIATGGGTYLWSNGQTTASINVSPTLSTTYTVTVTNSSGCTSTDQVFVNVTGIPLSAIASATNTAFCKGKNTQLDVTVSGATGVSTFAWSSNPSGFSSTDKNPSVTPLVSTIYSVTITNGGKTTVATIPITVNPLPIPSAGNNVTITKGDSTILTASGGATYLWSTGATTTSIKVAPSTTSDYIVTVINANGCSAFAQVFVNVIQPITTNITTKNSNLCAGNSTQLEILASGGSNNNFTYVWSSNPSGFSSTLKNPTIFPTKTTIYTVTVSDGMTFSTNSITITVNALPNAPKITSKNDTLFSSVTSGNQWYLDGKLIPNATDSKFFATKSGNYQVIFTDKNGCTSELAAVFPFNKVATSDLEFSNEILIYPNPSSGVFYLNLKKINSNFKVEIFNIEGKKVFFYREKDKIDISSEVSGIYIIRIFDFSNHKTYLNKIILEK